MLFVADSSSKRSSQALHQTAGVTAAAAAAALCQGHCHLITHQSLSNSLANRASGLRAVRSSVCCGQSNMVSCWPMALAGCGAALQWCSTSGCTVAAVWLVWLPGRCRGPSKFSQAVTTSCQGAACSHPTRLYCQSVALDRKHSGRMQLSRVKSPDQGHNGSRAQPVRPV